MRHEREHLIALLLVLSIAIAWALPLLGQASEKDSDKLSPAFSQAAMGALADVYRWKEKVQADAKSPVSNPQSGKYLKSTAYEHLRQAQMAAKTHGDQEAGTMLQKHFSDVNAWLNKLIEARKNLDATAAVDPGSLNENPDLVKLNDCEKAFNAMLGDGTLALIDSCQ
jgi:hypothetical protein